jgi:hypothetical protein
MGGACDTYGDDRVAYGVCWKNVRERDHLENLSENGRIILEMIFKKWNGSKDVIDLVQVRDRWRAFVKAIMNIRVQ